MSDNSKELERIAKIRASSQKKLVFTNGCFDILHVGHIRYLTEAKSLGDLLVIGLNSDSSIKELKGESRPIVNEQERKEMLLALKSVDFVLLFSEQTPLNLIKEVMPDVLVKGGDWKPEQIVGADVVKASGGEVCSLSFVDGKSTTNIIDRIKQLGSSVADG